MEQVREPLLTVAEVAGHLQVRQSWVYGKVAVGEMPHVRVGRYLRFRLSEVIAWVEGNGMAA